MRHFWLATNLAKPQIYTLLSRTALPAKLAQPTAYAFLDKGKDAAA